MGGGKPLLYATTICCAVHSVFSYVLCNGINKGVVAMCVYGVAVLTPLCAIFVYTGGYYPLWGVYTIVATHYTY